MGSITKVLFGAAPKQNDHFSAWIKAFKLLPLNRWKRFFSHLIFFRAQGSTGKETQRSSPREEPSVEAYPIFSSKTILRGHGARVVEAVESSPSHSLAF